MEHFNFDAPAELFCAAWRNSNRNHMTYRRFDTGAEAVKYAMESIDPRSLGGIIVEANEVRIGAAEIKSIYASAQFPLRRAARDLRNKSSRLWPSKASRDDISRD